MLVTAHGRVWQLVATGHGVVTFVWLRTEAGETLLLGHVLVEQAGKEAQESRMRV